MHLRHPAGTREQLGGSRGSTPFSPPSGPTQRLFQQPPPKANCWQIWKHIALPKRKSPCYDETRLTIHGTLEVHEYKTIGGINDEEIGNPSETKEAAYAG